jgi:hypothetical protein
VICALIFVDSKVERTTAQERMCATALIESFEGFVNAAVAGYSARPAQTEQASTAKRKSPRLLTHTFFAAFDSAFVESKLSFIFERIADKSSDCHRMIGEIAIAHPSLLPKLVRRIVDKVSHGEDNHFWHRVLAAVLVPSPDLISVVPTVIQVIKDILATDDRKRYSDALVVAKQLTSVGFRTGFLNARPSSLEWGVIGRI